jgi:uncharacterized protein (DUF488 family)
LRRRRVQSGGRRRYSPSGTRITRSKRFSICWPCIAWRWSRTFAAFLTRKRHPHFSREALAEALSGRGIGYRHFPSLGGKYKVTAQFGEGLDQLIAAAAESVVAAMCAEADPMNCHRRHIADAAAARGVDVIHLLPGGGFRHHEYHPGLFDEGE